jgi:hypothetical protein
MCYTGIALNLLVSINIHYINLIVMEGYNNKHTKISGQVVNARAYRLCYGLVTVCFFICYLGIHWVLLHTVVEFFYAICSFTRDIPK